MKLVGLALIGNVRAVEYDRVQVGVENDLEQWDYHWFPYSTGYSSPDNTGWYFMPEIGDRVRLVFPNKKEAESYGIVKNNLLTGKKQRQEFSLMPKLTENPSYCQNSCQETR